MPEKFRRAAHHQPADKDGDDEEGEIVHPAYAHAAEPAVDLHVEHLHHAAQRRLAVVHRVDGTVRGDGRHHTPHGRGRRTDPNLLAFHRAEILRDAHFIDMGIAAHLLRNGYEYTDRKGDEHNAEDTSRQFLTSDIESETPRHGHRNDQNRPAFEHVGKGVGVLERMRGVGSEITAAVGSELLDRHDSRRRSLRDHLLVALEGGDRLLAVERHRRAVNNQQNTDQQRKRHQDTGRALDHVYPKVADRLGGFGGQPLHDPGHRRHAASRGNELKQHDHVKLSKIAQSRFSAVMLQVTVHHERDAGVERQIGSLSRVAVRIERQPTLAAEQHHAPHEPEKVDHQQGLEELLPVHFLLRVDHAELVHPFFYGSHEVEPRALALVHFGHVASQRIAEHDQGHPLQNDA